MNKKIAWIVILVIIIAGGAWFYMTSSRPPEMMPANTQPESTVLPTSKTSESVVKEFTVTGQNFSFTPSAMTVKKGDRVKITFKNSGGTHDFRIDEFNVATKNLASGAEETLTFVADKTGMFEYYCSVGTHRAMGMKGTLTVQ